MNSMNADDQQFFDLAMKSFAGQASAAEEAELNSLLTSRPELKAKFDRLKADAGIAKEVLPLMEATEAQAGKLPEYARGRLQTKVRETLRKGQTPTTTVVTPAPWRWGWAIGLAAAAAVTVAVFLIPSLVAQKMVIQVAMLDRIGDTRGTTSNPAAIIQQALNQPKVETFSASAELKRWMGDWPTDGQQPVVKVIYDRDAGEVRIVGHIKGKPSFEKTFPVQREQDLAAVLKAVQAFIQEQAR
ncbi:MAG: hypothetical protein HZA88_20495 [Verrucomicrobia bacterium]|nr:hypothetical protein [Verrucomicrobiota bacterium]